MLAPILGSALLLLASAVAQSESTVPTDAPGFLTIQTSVPDFPPPSTGGSIVVTDSCIGDGCGTTATGGGLSILPITTSVSITLPQATTGLSSIISDTGIISIPAGETPLPTAASSQSSSASPSGTGSSTPSSSTAAAAVNQVPGLDKVVVLPFAVSTLFVALGFAWTLA
ncbi:hypothetical protein BDV96DRAFT_643236 [Lophiotrema nucula]|uniref:GPI anchored protein n=1 Tax=Lophiotrema nucula TaxID=690887 RepID=A0A6A5ZJT5_9PLEO|nr:hypothetical protein BDV96DRAFT_643236 [Lophiotrema nucula]